MLSEVYTSLKDTRTESKTRRQELKNARDELKGYKDKEEEAKRAGMTDLQKAQDDNKTLSESLTTTKAELDSALAKLEFYQAGVSDLDSVTALWTALPADKKKETNPKDWAAALKEQKPHLFGSVTQAAGGFGGNPNNDAQGNGGRGNSVNTHPSNLAEVNSFWKDYDANFSN